MRTTKELTGFISIPNLSWYWIHSKVFLEDWEKILLQEYNLWKTTEIMEELVGYLNTYLEVPFALVDADEYHYRLLEYYHIELEAMSLPPTDTVVTSMGVLVEEEGSYNYQSCVFSIISVLKSHTNYLNKVKEFKLVPNFETGTFQWFLYLG